MKKYFKLNFEKNIAWKTENQENHKAYLCL